MFILDGNQQNNGDQPIAETDCFRHHILLYFVVLYTVQGNRLNMVCKPCSPVRDSWTLGTDIAHKVSMNYVHKVLSNVLHKIIKPLYVVASLCQDLAFMKISCDVLTYQRTNLHRLLPGQLLHSSHSLSSLQAPLSFAQVPPSLPKCLSFQVHLGSETTHGL